MYYDYFGLAEQPFSIAVNPRYLYMSSQHREALAHLSYGIQSGGFVMLSGEVGTGKTTIVRCLLEQLPENTDIAIVLNPMATTIEMLQAICDELSITYSPNSSSIKELTDALQQDLLERYTAGKNTVLLIDEAQLLSPECLEQIRLLTNLETHARKLLQVVLVGQPELNQLLAQPRLRQLSQRITARYHLRSLTAEETAAYIRHRLKVAGMPRESTLFSPSVVKHIHQCTNGIPRRINILCERALIGAYGHNKQQIDKSIVNTAREEVFDPTSIEHTKARYSPKLLFALSATLGGLFILVIGFAFFMIFSSDKPEQKSAAVSASQTNVPPTNTTQANIPQTNSHQATQNLPLEQNKNKSIAQSQPTNKQTNQSSAPQDNAQQTISPNNSPMTPVSDDEWFFTSFTRTQARLLKHLGYLVSPDVYPCWTLANSHIRCVRTEVGSWQDIKAINRPGVLTIEKRGRQRYAILVGLSGQKVTLLTRSENKISKPLVDIAQHWRGKYFYAWQMPPGYEKPLQFGQKNESVRWVAEKFALLDGQVRPLTDNRFNRLLQQRVKLFQKENKLVADGIIGDQTLMRLNELLDIDPSL